ncbi:DUF2975 domain-containing protein [Fontisubflavum oceani]|uniref:DUF2975 domain-containing protein n=1 Tax=Fontisubflavum oceani TaxID=2978973 RepID=UPI0025B2DB82|nr:DUF2975 domain-containing protein [Fontisubflavum oceani]WJY22589.1 DUF2975 domain-containing protein [Fontisubflavum oceani]
MLPVILIVAFAIDEMGVDDIRDTYSDYVLPPVIGPGLYGIILAIEMVSVVIAAYILWQMRTLFGFYKSGETLSARCADRILRIGQGLVTVGVVGFLSNTAIVLLLTMANQAGSRTLSLTFTDGDIGFFLAGGLIVVIGWVMREAVQVAEENRGFV